MIKCICRHIYGKKLKSRLDIDKKAEDGFDLQISAVNPKPDTLWHEIHATEFTQLSESFF